MNTMPTGRRYELSGAITELDAVWPAIKSADPRALRISAPHDNVSTIGTDDKDAALRAILTNSIGILMVEAKR